MPMRLRANLSDGDRRRPLAAPLSPPEGWRDVRRLLAIRLDNLGDVILLGPALRTLRRALPEMHLVLMATSAGAQAAPLLPWIDDVLVHRPVWQDLSGKTALEFDAERGQIETLRRESFDAAAIFTSFRQSPYPPAFACFLAGIPLRLGQSREFGGAVLNPWIQPPPDEMHQADRNLFLLESAGFEPDGRDLELHVPQDAAAQADALLHDEGLGPDEPFVLLAPGASCEARRYDPARFAEVARQLAERLDLALVIVGSRQEAERIRPVAEAACGRAISLVGRTSVPMLAHVVRRARIVVANNSAPLHLAEAFCRPMVILYSGTDREEQWRPRRAPARLLRQPTACHPCYHLTCPYAMECLDVAPREVVQAVLDLMRRTDKVEAPTEVPIGGSP